MELKYNRVEVVKCVCWVRVEQWMKEIENWIIVEKWQKYSMRIKMRLFFPRVLLCCNIPKVETKRFWLTFKFKCVYNFILFSFISYANVCLVSTSTSSRKHQETQKMNKISYFSKKSFLECCYKVVYVFYSRRELKSWVKSCFHIFWEMSIHVAYERSSERERITKCLKFLTRKMIFFLISSVFLMLHLKHF